jgi:hypothetical protein
MNNSLETSVIIPSVVGIGKTDFGLLTAGNLRRASRETPHVISWDGTQYLAGEGVEKFARPIERMDFLRLADSIEGQVLNLVTLGSLAGQSRQLHTSLMVGLPVEAMLDRPLASQILRDLRSWFGKVQRFTLDGDEYLLAVDDLQAAAQPAGAYFSWGMNNQGKWSRAIADLDALVGIADIGFNTLDVFSVSGGQVVGKFTGGDTAGIRRAAEILMRQVKERFDISLSRHEADHYLRDSKPILSCSEGDIDLTPFCKQALESAASGIGDFLETLWGNGKQFRYLLFTGGGAEMIKPQLIRRYPHGQILPNPVLANALGLARYGRRIFKNAETVIGLDPGFGGFKAVCLQNA